MRGDKTYGHKSLLVRLIIPILFVCIVPNGNQGLFNNLFVFSLGFLALNWQTFNCRRIIISDQKLIVRGFLGLRKEKKFFWTDLKSVAMHQKDYRYSRYYFYQIYLYRKDISTPKISLSGMLWFERKKLMIEIEKHVPVQKDATGPIPKFWDLM